MAKKKVKKVKKERTNDEKIEFRLNRLEACSDQDSALIEAINSRIDRLVAALATARPIKKDM
jgi:hypothetical protein